MIILEITASPPGNSFFFNKLRDSGDLFHMTPICNCRVDVGFTTNLYLLNDDRSILIFFLCSGSPELKELSFCHKLWFSNPYISASLCRRPLIFQNMNSVRTNNPSLKYLRFRLLGCKDIGIGKFEFVAKYQFLYSLKIKDSLLINDRWIDKVFTIHSPRKMIKNTKSLSFGWILFLFFLF